MKHWNALLMSMIKHRSIRYLVNGFTYKKIINLLIDIKLNHSFVLLTWFIYVLNGHNYDVIKMVIKLMDVNIRFNVHFTILLYYQISNEL